MSDDYGYFDYAIAPRIFLGRQGKGPLKIAWDTNVLLDYLQHGLALWEGNPIPVSDPKYLEDLTALDALINLYALWDIRFYLFDRILVDAKKELPADRKAQRERALDRFAAALYYATYETHVEKDGGNAAEGLFSIDSLAPYSALPEGHDRMLVKEALERGMHVFLTRDEGILKTAARFSGLGLLIARPAGLCDLIDEAGIPAHQFPAPDFARIARIIEALGEYSDGTTS